MYRLGQHEQLALMIGIFSVILLVLEAFFFSSNFLEKIFFLGGTTIGASLIIIYVFIIQPMKGHIRTSPYYTSISSSFHPDIIPPPKTVKKTIMKGVCQFCKKPALMGFTCSYCDGYFCTEHRLPEKHNCIGLRKR